MASVKITVNEQTYQIACDEGEEERVTALGAYLDGHVKHLAEKIGRNAGHQLMLLAALTVCDELFTAREELTTAQNALRKQAQPSAAALEKVANRLSALVDENDVEKAVKG